MQDIPQLLWDEKQGETRVMRGKENVQDYRYFPEPDLPPLRIDLGWLTENLLRIPELPALKRHRFQQNYGLTPVQAKQLCETQELADYFEQVAAICNSMPLVVHWLTGEFLFMLKERGMSIRKIPLNAKRLAELLQLIQREEISSSAAKKVFEAMWDNQFSAAEMVEKMDLQQISNETELLELIRPVLLQNSKQIAAYKEGKKQLFGFFVGQVMRQSAGRANPEQVRRLLERELTDA